MIEQTSIREFTEVFATFTERQKNAVYWIIGTAVEAAETVDHSQCIRIDQT